ncbi:unnamed protein product, partial [Prorocentrum cordatum]
MPRAGVSSGGSEAARTPLADPLKSGSDGPAAGGGAATASRLLALPTGARGCAPAPPGDASQDSDEEALHLCAQRALARPAGSPEPKRRRTE